MVLSDNDIEKALDSGDITVNPLFPDCIQPASIDLHLGRHFLVFIRNNDPFIDPSIPIEKMMREVEIKAGQPFVLHANEFALGILEEEVGINDCLVGQLDGLSSVGRLGTFVHVTASTLNPGNKLCMTLELYNANHAPINLYWGMPIAQIQFKRLCTPCKNPYGSQKLNNNNYGGSKKPQPSQYFKKFQDGRNTWQDFVKNLEQ